MSKKETTIDDLAMMVQKGFISVDKRFDGVDTRLDGMDTRLDGIDTRLDGMDTRLNHIENLLIRDHTNRIERLEDISRQLQVKLGVDLRT